LLELNAEKESLKE